MGVPARLDTGMRVPVSAPTDETANVLVDIVLERHRQIHLHGHNENTPDGTGPDVCWLDTPDPYLGHRGAADIEKELRRAYEMHVRRGEPLTFMHFLREEFAEAMLEDDPAKLYTELSQVAAVAVSWMEKIRQR